MSGITSRRELLRPHGLRPHGTAGFTLIELLLVLAVMTVLTCLILPAVQGAREAARLTACRHNVRQVACAVLRHDAVLGHMPSGGWGSTWLGVASRDSDSSQPGGWIYDLLTSLEATEIHDAVAATTAATAAADYATLAAGRVPSLSCPSRRSSAPRLLAAGGTYRTPFGSTVAISRGVVTDYAANGGSFATCPPLDLLQKAMDYLDGATNVMFCHAPSSDVTKQNTLTQPLSKVLRTDGSGHSGHALDHIGPCVNCSDNMSAVAVDPSSLSEGDQWRQLNPYVRVTLADAGVPDLQDGIVARMSQVRAAMIRDGLSTTYLLGEKYVAADRYDANAVADAGDDRPMVAGYSNSSIRWGYDPPAKDTPGVSRPGVFGSAHPAGWNAAFADGSVVTLSFTIDPTVHKALAGRADGTAVSRPE